MMRAQLVVVVVVWTACGEEAASPSPTEEAVAPAPAPAPPAPPPEPTLAPEDEALGAFIEEHSGIVQSGLLGRRRIPLVYEHPLMPVAMTAGPVQRDLLLMFSPARGASTRQVSVGATVLPGGRFRYTSFNVPEGAGRHRPPISRRAAAHAQPVVQAMERVRTAILEHDCELPYIQAGDRSADPNDYLAAEEAARQCAAAQAALREGLHPSNEMLLSVRYGCGEGMAGCAWWNAQVRFEDGGISYAGSSEPSVQVEIDPSHGAADEY